MTATRKRVTIICLSIVLASTMIIGATWAYFTSSDTVTNVFTVGSGIKVSIDEEEWDKDPDSGKDVIPGNVFIKDPLITMDQGQGYVRLIMTIEEKNSDPDNHTLITDSAILALVEKTLFYDKGYPNSPTISKTGNYTSAQIALWPVTTVMNYYNKDNFEWKSSGGGKYVFWYKNSAGYLMQKDEAAYFITHVVFPADWDSDGSTKEIDKLKNGYEVVFRVEAIQDAGFTSATEAFAALDAQLNP